MVIIAALLWGAVLSWLPVPSHFKVKTVELKMGDFNSGFSYHDLNIDGHDDVIQFSYPYFDSLGRKSSRIEVDLGLDNGFYQYVPGDICSDRLFFYDDVNGDHLDEMMIFTHRDSSLMLSVWDVMNDTLLIEGLSVACCTNFFKYGRVKLDYRGCYDRDGDGMKEVYLFFGKSNAYDLCAFYCFDIFRNKVDRSAFVGADMKNGGFMDVTGDSVPELISFANGSVRHEQLDVVADINYDHSWLLVLDVNLRPVFTPLQLGDCPAMLHVTTAPDSGLFYCFVRQEHGLNQKVSCQVRDKEGGLVRKKLYDDHGEGLFSNMIKVSHSDYLALGVDDDNMMYGVRNDLSLIPFYCYSGYSKYWSTKVIDVNDDGFFEYALYKHGQSKVLLVIPQLKQEYTLFYCRNIAYPFEIKPFHGKYKNAFSVVCGSEARVIQLNVNPVYFWRYPLYVLLGVVIYLLLLAIWRLIDYRRLKRDAAERKLMESQMLGAQKMMSPHLTMNLMSSIADLFDKQDREMAYKVFNRYTKMLRDTLVNADSLNIPLDDELDFVRNYLELERFRLANSFSWHLEVDPKVDLLMDVPRMVVYTFVENAIKHGLRHLAHRQGKLNIRLAVEDKYCVIVVEDNGVGRKLAKEYNTIGSGRGLEIIDQVLAYQRKRDHKQTSYAFTDLLSADHEPMGTRVIIHCSMN